jgi:signal transduction histidine kinase
MNKRDYKLSILLGVIIIAINFIVITPILFIQYHSSSSIFQDSLIKEFENEFNLTKFFIESEFLILKNHVRTYSDNERVKIYLQDKKINKVQKEIEQIYNNTSRSDFLAVEINETKTLHDVSINKLRDNNIFNEYIKTTTVGKNSIVKSENIFALFTSEAISSDITGEQLGVIYSGVILNDNIDLILKISEKLNHKNVFIIHDNKEIVGTNKLSKKLLSFLSKNKTNELIPFGNKVYYKGLYSITNTDLEFVYLSNRNVLYNLRASFFRTIFLTIFITIILSLSAVAIANKALLPPLKRLLNYLENSIRDEELKVYHKSSIKEFNLISYSFATVFQNLQKQKGTLNKLINSSHLPTLIFDSNLNLVQYNDSAKVLLGLKGLNDNIISDSFLKSCYRFSQLITNLKQGNEVINEEVIFKSFDEWKHTSWTISFEKSDQIYFAQCIDNTEKVITRNEIERERARTIHNQKLASLGEVAGSIAHEVNNPMGVISLSLSLLEREVKELTQNNEEKSKLLMGYFKNIEDSVHRTTSIVSYFLDFSRDSKRDKLEIKNVKEIFSKTFIFIDEKINKSRIKLDIDISDEIYFLVKETQFTQVIINLINNSIDALKSSKVKKIKISAKETKTSCEIHITDSGPGIAKTIQESIYIPFFTTKLKGQGTGLGLSISKTIIEEMSGTLELQKSSIGAHFVLTLPKNRENKSTET